MTTKAIAAAPIGIEADTSRLKSLWGTIGSYIPAAVVAGLIALYYVQLSLVIG